jgi:pSer/pThr/pTyr-binding forkhead associated (FHA) protein
MWILRGAAPGDAILTFRVTPGTMRTVGRDRQADFVVDAALVSRMHCRLEARDDAIEVVDLSSTNGTYVNGKRVERAALSSGDQLRVGRLELRVDREPAAGPIGPGPDEDSTPRIR